MKYSNFHERAILFLLVFFSCFAISTSAMAGLRAHWELDEGAGTIAGDSTENGNTGTLINGPIWTAGQFNGALDFDGQNDRVTVDATPLAMNTWNEISVAAWVKNDIGAGAGTDDIISQWIYPSSRGWVLTHHNNNQYFWEINGKGFISGGSVNTDWTHVAGTYDGNAMRLYVNGVEVASVTGLSGSLPFSSADVIIGSQADASNFFNGIIDDVRIYDSALTAQEVLDLYNGATPEPDITPPTIPENLTEVSVDFTSAEISWTASDDPESGIDHYNIYRDSTKISESTLTTFIDNDLNPDTTYRYEISAVNGQGLPSELSLHLDVTTLADTTPPSIISVAATENSVAVEFDEDLDNATASDKSNYTISFGITISSAVLDANNRTVTLTTSAHSEGIDYDITIDNVEDLAGNPIPQTIETYSVILTDPYLQAHWTLDDGAGSLASDASGNGNDGTLVNGPVWTTGGLNGALIFDGQNDQVRVDSTPLAMETWNEISVGAWVKNDNGTGAGTDDIISQWNYPSSRGWVLTHHNNDQYFWEINGKGFIYGGTVSTDWTHVMGTYDGSTMRLYVNGIEIASDTGLSGNLPFSTADIIIGSQADGSNFFDGVIDDVRIYGRTLSEQEIQDIVVDFNPDSINDPPTVTVSASPQAGLVPLPVQFSADVQDTDGTIVSYSWNFGDGGTSGDPNPNHTYNSTGLFTASVMVTDDQGATAVDTIDIDVRSQPAGPANFDVWYGLDQNFGDIGIPQTWANILGNVSDPDGIASLSYTINGGSSVDLSIGPDDRRLVMAGDFNIEIGFANLLPGTNSIQITATDQLGDDTTEIILVQYDDTQIWPLPYSVDWNTVTNIQDVVQVVDGLWSLTPEGLRIAEMGYDRVIAIGDVLWTDYEVTVPITVNDYDSGPLPPYSVSAGFGITMRWTGHTDNPVSCPQPHCGWLPSGAGAWYNIGSGGPLYLNGAYDYTVSIDVGDTFIWKYRVETIEGVGPRYYLKVWPEGTSEPSSWNIERQRGLSDEPQGSPIIILHHVDATIGDVSVIPVGASVPDTTPPTVESVTAISDSEVIVIFSERVDQDSATDFENNYFIDNGIVISGASLGADEKTVTLTTNAHLANELYTIQISDVTDKASPPNIMVPDSLEYTFTPPQPNQPVLQYLFDEGSGSVANDSSGNGYDGDLVNGPVWVNDPQQGSVIGLDGVNDHIAIDALPLGMDTWSELTVAAWVKNDVGAGAGTDDVLSWWRWNGYPCSDCSFVLTHHNNNQYFFQMGNSYLSGGAVSTGWTYVVATYDGSMIRLYVNGIEVASTPHSGGISFSSADLIVGGQADGSNYFAGRIDEVEIFDVALTQQEIISRYNN